MQGQFKYVKIFAQVLLQVGLLLFSSNSLNHVWILVSIHDFHYNYCLNNSEEVYRLFEICNVILKIVLLFNEGTDILCDAEPHSLNKIYILR